MQTYTWHLQWVPQRKFGREALNWYYITDVCLKSESCWRGSWQALKMLLETDVCLFLSLFIQSSTSISSTGVAIDRFENWETFVFQMTSQGMTTPGPNLSPLLSDMVQLSCWCASMPCTCSLERCWCCWAYSSLQPPVLGIAVGVTVLGPDSGIGERRSMISFTNYFSASHRVRSVRYLRVWSGR